ELGPRQSLQVLVQRPVAAVCHVVHGLAHEEDERTAGVRIGYGLTDIILDRRVIGDTHPDVDVLLHRRVTLSDIDQTQGDTVPAGRGAEQEEWIDALVVGVGSVTLWADHAVGPEDDVIEFERARLVAAQAEAAPLRAFGYDLVVEGEPAGEIHERAGEI